jgi:hypothetical protein
MFDLGDLLTTPTPVPFPTQKEVENFYITGGYLLPKFHQAYWLGFNTSSNWPDFTQIDRTFATMYRNWGTYSNGQVNKAEPNNLMEPEWCLATNYSQAVRNAWGYQDTVCTSKFAAMCRNISEWPTRLAEGQRWPRLATLQSCSADAP